MAVWWRAAVRTVRDAVGVRDRRVRVPTGEFCGLRGEVDCESIRCASSFEKMVDKRIKALIFNILSFASAAPL